MKYNSYDIEDFLLDPDFIDWVKEPDEEKSSFFHDWLLTNPDNLREALLAKEMLLKLRAEKLSPSEEEFEESLLKILSHKNQESNRHSERDVKTNTVTRKQPIWKWISVAASVILCGWFLWSVDKEQELAKAPAPVWITKQVPFGKKLIITLPDKSKIRLNSGSSVSYQKAFTANRQVRLLNGEAFFEVRKMNGTPFTVQSGDMTITVVGTSFNVRSFSDEDEIQVAVMTGKVITANSPEKDNSFVAHLTPNEVIRYEKNTGNYTKKHVPNLNIPWKNNTILFKDASLKHVLSELERWYGYSFEIPKEQKDLPGRINGEYKGKSLAEVLDGLVFSMKFDYRIDHKNKKVFLSKRR
ncbi:hypothetical protein FUAX_14540 [Fulvitalea axinellae]|uniref:FecR family protein n=1 Tax=Fulvitalea axinellae TaxID=1182444 RepID=A0AAU9CUA4_9BACT|nr:hypothetical protein FUAX_14540 [Fulvitalea axinellae]